MLLPNGVKFTCCGDEPYNEEDYEFVKGSDWLTHERSACMEKQISSSLMKSTTVL